MAAEAGGVIAQRVKKTGSGALEHPETVVIAASRTTDLLGAYNYIDVRELNWNERAQIGPAAVQAFEVSYWGARMRNDTYRGFDGYLIECGRYRMVFGGDSAYTQSFRRLRTSRAVNLAIMPIGAYNPWIHAHCTPEQALAMANDAGANFILPVHRSFEFEPRADRSRARFSPNSADSHRSATPAFHGM